MTHKNNTAGAPAANIEVLTLQQTRNLCISSPPQPLCQTGAIITST